GAPGLGRRGARARMRAGVQCGRGPLCAPGAMAKVRSARGRLALFRGRIPRTAETERRMNIHEYQAKELLKRYGVAVLRGGVAYTADEAVAAAETLGGPVWVVKAQIHAGGRGKGRFLGDDSGKGGVRLARSTAEVREAAAAMLGRTLV